MWQHAIARHGQNNVGQFVMSPNDLDSSIIHRQIISLNNNLHKTPTHSIAKFIVALKVANAI